MNDEVKILYYKDYNFGNLSKVKDQGLNKGRDRKKTHYLDMIATFDIETSTDVLMSCATMIMWMFDFRIRGKDTVIYGRTYDELLECFQLINQGLRKHQSKNKMCLRIYDHNLSYEWNFLKDDLALDPDNCFALSLEKIVDFWYFNGRIEMRDSLCLSGKSLEETTRFLKCKKAVGKWDYKKVRTTETELTPEELEYCVRDVVSLAEYISVKLKRWGKFINIPLTSTGETLEDFRRFVSYSAIKDNNGKRSYSFGRNYYYPYIAEGDKKYTLSVEEYKQLRNCYSGGFCGANMKFANRTLANVKSIDITSSYPNVIASEKFPTRFEKWSKDGWLKHAYKNENYAYIITIKISGIKAKNRGFGIIPKSRILQYGRKQDIIFYDDKVITVPPECYIITAVNEIDFEVIKAFYDFTYARVEIITQYDNINENCIDEETGEILKGECVNCPILVSRKKYLPRKLVAYVLQEYNKKSSIKEQIKSLESEKIKTRIIKSETGTELDIIPIERTSKWKELQLEYSEQKKSLNSIYGCFVKCPVRDKFTVKNINGHNEIVKEENDKDIQEQLDTFYSVGKKPIGQYSWGVWIASYARRNIISMIMKIGVDNFVYSDTDSVKFIYDEKIDKLIDEYNETAHQKIMEQLEKNHLLIFKDKINGLGEFKDEGLAEKFKTLGAKKYIYFQNNILHTVVAGLSKELGAKEIGKRGVDVAFSFFSAGLKLENVGKTTEYKYYDAEFVVNGKHYRKQKSCLIIKETAFILKVNTYSKKFEQYLVKSIEGRI